MARGINCLINTSSKRWLCSQCLTAQMHIHVLFSKSDLNCSRRSQRQAHTEITHIFIAFPYTQACTPIFRQTPLECRTYSNIYDNFKYFPYYEYFRFFFFFRLSILIFPLSLEIVIFTKLLSASWSCRTLWPWPNSKLRIVGKKVLLSDDPCMGGHLKHRYLEFPLH